MCLYLYLYLWRWCPEGQRGGVLRGRFGRVRRGLRGGLRGGGVGCLRVGMGVRLLGGLF